jgi:hypothetical protein
MSSLKVKAVIAIEDPDHDHRSAKLVTGKVVTGSAGCGVKGAVYGPPRALCRVSALLRFVLCWNLD